MKRLPAPTSTHDILDCEQHRPDSIRSISKGRTRHTAYPSADVMLASGLHSPCHFDRFATNLFASGDS